MKFKNGVVILEDEANGKAYARQLNGWEQNLVLAQLQALDGGALKVVEIAPIIVRGANVSEARARQIMAERPQTVAEGMAEVLKGGAPVALKSATGSTVAQKQADNDRAARRLRESTCPHEWISSEGRTASGWLCRKCGEYERPACKQCDGKGTIDKDKCAIPCPACQEDEAEGPDWHWYVVTEHREVTHGPFQKHQDAVTFSIELDDHTGKISTVERHWPHDEIAIYKKE